MIRALTTAASGMDAQQTRLDVTSNNIANVSTPGFKRSRAEFQDLLYQTIRGPGAPANQGSPTGTQIGMGVRTVGTQRLHSLGDRKVTDRPLDLSIEGEGFFTVSLPSGDKAYTRAGDFQRNAEGRLVTADGLPLGSDITIPPDAVNITVNPDGAVMVLSGTEKTPTEVGKIEIATFINPSGLQAMGKNLFRETVASGTPIIGVAGENGTGTMAQGSLELSNVKVVEEMVDLISGQRAYEVNARVIKAADEMLGQTANLR